MEMCFVETTILGKTMVYY